MKYIILVLSVIILLLVLPSLHFAEDVYFYHTDNFGTPMAMTDQTGEVVWRADELPFGEEYETEELPQQNNRRFLGKELDKETGLVYMGARYLDPKTGRFTQPDPVGIVDPFNHGKINQVMLENPQRQNRYVYGLNNPYKYIDPDGLAPSPVLVEEAQQFRQGMRSELSKTTQKIQSVTQATSELAATVAMGAGGKAVSKVAGKSQGLITPKKYFGNKTYQEAEKALTKKFGPPRGGGKYNKSYFNERTKRTYNLHHDPSHRGGKPHIDIRKRDLPTSRYKDRFFRVKRT